MTPEQIETLKMAAKPNSYSEWVAVLSCVQAIETATREECAKQVEQDLYPYDSQKLYTQHYNSCIKRLAEKIRSGT